MQGQLLAAKRARTSIAMRGLRLLPDYRSITA
jgi:hypothetical protein